MLSLSMVRAKCYLILQGLERSLADNIIYNYPIEDASFLTTDEQDRALSRLREDFGESEWSLEDVRNEDILLYLDLGDLINLLNRHISHLHSIPSSEVKSTTKILHTAHLPAIRKRVMHPIRPLEVDDLSTLMGITQSLADAAPNLNWTALLEGTRVAKTPGGFLDISIPKFWTEDSTLLHNLPPAEFDDTGFIGRTKERRQLKNLLESDHNVVTVVGAGGVGKTALALRVCHDILDDQETSLERIVWVSLKTQYLTADGVQTIINAVDTAEALVDRLLSAINVATPKHAEVNWDRVLEQMRVNRTLLVIDNLETLGDQIRDLAVSVPRGSKLLLTSRIGLGEIELRYQMPDLSVLDAVKFMRNLGVAYNYESVAKWSEVLLKQYCHRLHYNPLLIKWFVQAVGRGTRPEDVLSSSDVAEVLDFCWGNIYDRLSELARSIISTLQAARRNLTQTQIQELLAIDHISFVEGLQELYQSNIVEGRLERDGSTTIQIGSLVNDYLSRYHPPSNAVVKSTRSRLQQWQSEHDRSAIQQNTYRYAQRTILVETNDERIAVPHLRHVLNMLRANDAMAAQKSLKRAQDLTPQWWEVYRVKAQMYDFEHRPIYEIEQAFEESISCRDTDVNRFHYAVYLMKVEEYDRALEQIEQASKHYSADEVSLRSVKGQILLRSGLISEALIDLKYVSEYDEAAVPINIKRVHGTQYASALRRRVEQLYSLGNDEFAAEEGLKGITVADRTARDYGWDWKLAEEGVKLLADTLVRSDVPFEVNQSIVMLASKWDHEPKFNEECRDRVQTRLLFDRNVVLTQALPETSKLIQGVGRSRRYNGTIKFVTQGFGFITTDAVGEVHMDRSSLSRTVDWRELRTDQRVVFEIVREDRGPHAVELEPEL